MKQIDIYQIPCTRNIELKGFGNFLEKEIGQPRKNIRLFAKELSQILTEGKEDISGYLTLTNSGSSANLVAALALAEKIRRESKPLTAVASAFTFPTTMSALLLAGFDVTLVDVDEQGFNLSLSKLGQLPILPSLVVVTHFLGFPADMQGLLKYKEKTGCLILQDACETLVSHVNNQLLYQFGDVVTWSFYHPHHLSSYGGGAVYARAKEDFILCDSMAHWGRACKCHIDSKLCTVPFGPAHQFTYENIGVNVEMSELNACFGRWQLLHWNKIETQRKKNYAYLYENLKDNPRLKVWNFYNLEQDSPFVFPILIHNKCIHEIWPLLSKQGIEIRTLMGGATSLQTAYQCFLAHNTHCPNAEYMSDHAFFVGCHHTLDQDDMEHICQALANL